MTVNKGGNYLHRPVKDRNVIGNIPPSLTHIHYIRKGYCCMCGDCCSKYDMTNSLIQNKKIIFLEDGYCSNIERWTMRCKIYSERPLTCSSFPQSPQDIIMLPNCTYYFEKVKEVKK